MCAPVEDGALSEVWTESGLVSYASSVKGAGWLTGLLCGIRREQRACLLLSDGSSS
jgi:hypothetical protein